MRRRKRTPLRKFWTARMMIRRTLVNDKSVWNIRAEAIGLGFIPRHLLLRVLLTDRGDTG
jgi:hypothetical protein